LLSFDKVINNSKEYYVFSRYLFRISFNAIHKSFRKHASDKRYKESVFKNFILEDGSANIDLEYNNLMEIAREYIEKLPGRQKSIFLMSISENLSNEEIANNLRISKNGG